MLDNSVRSSVVNVTLYFIIAFFECKDKKNVRHCCVDLTVVPFFQLIYFVSAKVILFRLLKKENRSAFWKMAAVCIVHGL